MTISKHNTKYDVSKDPRPKTITIGVSLITREVEHLIQDGKHIEIPVDDAICYLNVPYELVHLPCGGANYSAIAKLVEEQEGLRRTHWKIVHIWTPEPDYIADAYF